MRDDNGTEHRFHFETFFNRHDALILGVYQCPDAAVFDGGLPWTDGRDEAVVTYLESVRSGFVG